VLQLLYTRLGDFTHGISGADLITTAADLLRNRSSRQLQVSFGTLAA